MTGELLPGEPNLFHPERGEDLSVALSFCARCEVRSDCLAYALDADITTGVWGGSPGWGAEGCAAAHVVRP